MKMFDPAAQSKFETRKIKTPQGGFEFKELSAGFMEHFTRVQQEKGRWDANWEAIKAACLRPELKDEDREKLTAKTWNLLVLAIDEMNMPSEEDEKNAATPSGN